MKKTFQLICLRIALCISTDYNFLGSFSNHNDANKLISSKEIDIVFISFSDKSNIIDYIDTVNASFIPLFVVMSQDRDDIHEIKGTINIMDFLQKPISKQRLEVSLDIVNYGLEIRSCISTDVRLGQEFIFVKVDKRKIRIITDNILYVESVKDYMKIVTPTKKYLVYFTLTNFTKQFSSDKFMRVHRSYTVALDKVETIDSHTMEVFGEKRISFRRKYLEEIKDRLFLDKE